MSQIRIVCVMGCTKTLIRTHGEEDVEKCRSSHYTPCENTGAYFDYITGPVYTVTGSTGCHEWVIEFKQQPEVIVLNPGGARRYFGKSISDYDAKRYNDIVFQAASCSCCAYWYVSTRNNAVLGISICSLATRSTQ